MHHVLSGLIVSLIIKLMLHIICDECIPKAETKRCPNSPNDD